MIKIAICDDEQTMVSGNEDVVKDSLKKCGIAFEITTYLKSSNLLADIAEDGFFYDYIIISCIFFDGDRGIAEIETVPLRFFIYLMLRGVKKQLQRVYR